jgi:hypothetical protein
MTVTHCFTFGSNQVCTHPDMPTNLSDYWVAVELPDDYPEHHREVFMDEFSGPHMGGRTKFAFEYTEDKLMKGYFPRGELLRIVRSDD